MLHSSNKMKIFYQHHLNSVDTDNMDAIKSEIEDVLKVEN